ncbi:unnamed protein product [Polarella glacialis]|uniref:Reverse transcriptase Ty1/copia-type domain-containing protein n=1 Tax=Polarella glacialis TaxID=89957 RepID=A0A813E7K0_POLGL|nr:unnamed protein product [Polarella glacialis]
MMKSSCQERGLLDSGASHAVRAQRQTDRDIRPCVVELACGQRKEMMMTGEGTVIGSGATSPIVPMLLARQSCGIHFSDTKDGALKLTHPVLGELDIYTCNGVLEISATAAEFMINEIEQQQQQSRCAKVTPEEKLLEHKASGHRQYDRNCSECLGGAMRDRMHRRTGEAELQTLSADVVGPFAKADEHNYKYFLQAVFTIASQEESVEEELPELLGDCDPFVIMQEEEPTTAAEVLLKKTSDWSSANLEVLASQLPAFAALPEPVRASLVVQPCQSKTTPPGLPEKTAQHSDQLIVLLYAGADDLECLKVDVQKRWPEFRGRILAIDTCRTAEHDMLQQGLYAWLMGQGCLGNIVAVTGGPNCRTYSILRFYEKPNAPRPVRSREGPEQWGLNANTPEEQLQVTQDDQLMWRMKFLAFVADSGLQARCGEKLAYLLEHPRDPTALAERPHAHPRAKECCSHWCLDETKHYQELMSLEVYHFDQHTLGGVSTKHTTVETNLKVWPTRRITAKSSKDLARWAPGLRDAVASALQQHCASRAAAEEIQAVQRVEHYKTLRMAVPLFSKKSQEVLAALQLMKIRLQRLGFVIKRFHSDRGKEFDNRLVGQWCLNCDIYQSFAETEDHKSNGRCEAAVCQTKNKVRTLLLAAGCGPNLWPYAVTYADEQQQGSDKSTPPFGAAVMVRTRKQVRESDFNPRAVQGVYLCPLHNSTGALVMLDEDKVIYRTSAFVRLPVQPEVPTANFEADEIERGDPVIRLEALLASEEPDEESLVNKTVSTAEVRADLDAWRPAMRAEVDGLHTTGTVTDLLAADVRQYLADNDCEILPGKAVVLIKAGGRRKFRAVACGNFAQMSSEPGAKKDLYASGADATTVRVTTRAAAWNEWAMKGRDIKQAFLNADLTHNNNGKRILVRPPAVLVEAGLIARDTLWIVHKALYGLRESPKAWAVSRDKKLVNFEVTVGTQKFTLRQSAADPNSWAVVNQKGEKMGIVIVYVDDIVATGPEDLVDEIMSWVGRTWECTEVHSIDDPDGMTFCSIVIIRYAAGGGITLHQNKYIKDLVQRHGLCDANPLPLIFDKDECLLPGEPEDETTVNAEDVRAAQAITGELLFCSTRTRPDVSYSVNRMASLTAKEPRRVARMGQRVLKYLLGTVSVGLFYPDAEETAKLQETSALKLEAHWDYEATVAYTDISFAPEGAKSHGGFACVWAAAPVFWKNGKQAFPVMSTAEAELMEAVEGQIAAQAVNAIIAELLHEVKQTVAVDNTASVALLTGDCAPWRTRHLRIRGAVLRDRFATGVVDIVHVAGLLQLADLLTKTFPAPRMKELREQWLLRDTTANNNNNEPKAKKATTTTTNNNLEAARAALRIAVAALLPTASTAQMTVYEPTPDSYFNEALGDKIRYSMDTIAFVGGLCAIAYAVWMCCKTAGFAYKHGYQGAVCYVFGIYFDKECQTDAPPTTTTTTTTAGEIVIACDRRGVVATEVYHTPICHHAKDLTNGKKLFACKKCG